jgi:hypothetical protein
MLKSFDTPTLILSALCILTAIFALRSSLPVFFKAGVIASTFSLYFILVIFRQYDEYKKAEAELKRVI